MKNCPICNELITIISGLKINSILRTSIEEKYPISTKKRQEEVGSNNTPIIISGSKLKHLYFHKPNLHFIPRQSSIIMLTLYEASAYKALHHLKNQCVIVTDLKENNGRFYGFTLDPNLSRLHGQHLIVYCRARIIASNLGQTFIPELEENVDTCEIDEINDIIPQEETKQTEIINKSIEIYNTYKRIFNESMEMVKNEVINRGNQEPIFNQAANTEAKLRFGCRISLFIASNIRADSRNPKILYSTNPLERINWCEQMMINATPQRLFNDKSGLMTLLKFMASLIVCVAFLYFKRNSYY